jgi:ribonuclease VapC
LILDSSAVISVLRAEQGCGPLEDAIDAAPDIGIGAPTLFETAMVLTIRLGETGPLALSGFLRENGVELIPFDERHADLAAAAFARFGKGRHPARLNYGDCMTYATARLAGRPLLFIGDDFRHTDLAPALT